MAGFICDYEPCADLIYDRESAVFTDDDYSYHAACYAQAFPDDVVTSVTNVLNARDKRNG